MWLGGMVLGVVIFVAGWALPTTSPVTHLSIALTGCAIFAFATRAVRKQPLAAYGLLTLLGGSVLAGLLISSIIAWATADYSSGALLVLMLVVPIALLAGLLLTGWGLAVSLIERRCASRSRSNGEGSIRCSKRQQGAALSLAFGGSLLSLAFAVFFLNLLGGLLLGLMMAG